MSSKILAFPQLLVQKSNVSLILLFLLLKNVTTSSKTGSGSGGGDLPRHRSDRGALNAAADVAGDLPRQRGGGGDSMLGSSDGASRRDALFINGEIIPTAAAIEAAGRLAADLADYIVQTCQNPVPGSGQVSPTVHYWAHQQKLVLCHINTKLRSKPHIPEVGEVVGVEVLSSALGPVDLGTYLRSLGLPTNQILLLNITGSYVDGVKFHGKSLPNLQVLDLRGNNATVISIPESRTLTHIYLSGNEWPCIVPGSGVGEWSLSSFEFGRKMAWLVSSRMQNVWMDRDLTHCATIRTRKWFQHHFTKPSSYGSGGGGGQPTSPENIAHQLHDYLSFAKDSLASCPPGCDCELAKPLASDSIVKDEFRVSVICSYLNLTHLPVTVPERTIFLDASSNEIRSLTPLQGDSYRYLMKLNMWNNNLTSMEGLRNSWLLRNRPTEIDLRNNQLSQFDTSIWEPMLNEQSTRMTKVEEGLHFQFSDNPWSCHCETIKTVQDFLAKYQFLLQDADLMHCAEMRGASLHDVDYKLECAQEQEGDVMVWVVVFELSLLLAVLGKLGWDIVVYRQSGRLPWVARHLCFWSVPGISTARLGWRRWTVGSALPRETNIQRATSLGKASSSGYLTASANSSQGGQDLGRQKLLLPGGREASVVHFLDSAEVAHLQAVAERANF